jgi:hypothetical protein
MSSKFLQAFGFDENPFASTNADKEPNLNQYFVPPPYFASVRGDPADPKSNVVLAPRGGGKTAQKVMIEEYAENNFRNSAYCLAYDSFRHVTRQRISTVTIDWHLEQIIQRLLSGIITLMEQGHGANLDASDKRALAHSFPRFLGNLSAADAEQVFDSVKSVPEKARHLISRHGRNILSVVNSIIKGFGFTRIEIEQAAADLKDEPLQYILERLVQIMASFGFSSTYVLIDRVDEKIQNLLNVGAVLKSGEIENPGNRPLHQYSFSDPRLALVVLSAYSLEDILAEHCFVCPKCSTLLVREGDEIACDDCSYVFTPSSKDNLLSKCAR